MSYIKDFIIKKYKLLAEYENKEVGDDELSLVLLDKMLAEQTQKNTLYITLVKELIELNKETKKKMFTISTILIFYFVCTILGFIYILSALT